MNKKCKQRVSYIFINPNDNKSLEALLYESIVCMLAQKGSIPASAKDVY